ncbi:M15 family metallopeptidase [Sphingobacterium spiritivorum]|uniref:Serine-type D-Ala-D-Ala carboxypeptidase n=1 Tax=Sphingobacterium spiritivorum ATCC 33861 TaxID=525373 RepID=D7VN70_SPHSI|nr:M15 family metallopeptidase [Sphingobacterium spiritivorum]EFK57367.1 serine-type D-Ala-D-Ala carboxypeptidase [Sphingobacterium spiritivorum ATCC 33861]QQT36553.1 M15 family metallopeptidase [Sphingobacterium spiritivorum]WQD33304.1 M15 family metallopeptidase [Sphingobacterium spiritivorum]SUJ21742.1 Peptidoglycan L-alanyl-D-glutamate endopeptidase CwlK precursor [Sphingobacterium spiritivorum]
MADRRLQYADEITLARIELMHPKIREEVREIYLQINTALPKGVRLRLSQTLRTFKEQDELFNKRPKVTNAKGGQSIHNYGLAFDIVILYDKDSNGSFETASWALDINFMKVVNFFKSKGWTWGGDWKSFKDYPHFEKTFGNTWQSLIVKKSAKDSNGNYYVIL